MADSVEESAATPAPVEAAEEPKPDVPDVPEEEPPPPAAPSPEADEP